MLRLVACAYCGMEFESDHTTQKFCSSECRREGQKEYMEKYRSGSDIIPCLKCNREFQRITRSLICSECRPIKGLDKKRRVPQLILPFLEDIDRNAFGHWISGFTDGEGMFHLNVRKIRGNNKRSYGSALFGISLRDDDVEILRLIQSYWACGQVFPSKRVSKKISNEKPLIVYRVTKIENLMKIVVPHFDCFPLRAKKHRDFLIWRRGVELAYEIKNRLFVQDGRSRFQAKKWIGDDVERFSTLVTTLKEVRKYVPQVVTS